MLKVENINVFYGDLQVLWGVSFEVLEGEILALVGAPRAPDARMRRAEPLAGVYSHGPWMKERRKQMAGTMSGGEQQMAAIGRGLMALPKLLMFDEPSLGLSPILVQEVFDIAKRN